MFMHFYWRPYTLISFNLFKTQIQEAGTALGLMSSVEPEPEPDQISEAESWWPPPKRSITFFKLMFLVLSVIRCPFKVEKWLFLGSKIYMLLYMVLKTAQFKSQKQPGMGFTKSYLRQVLSRPYSISYPSLLMIGFSLSPRTGLCEIDPW